VGRQVDSSSWQQHRATPAFVVPAARVCCCRLISYIYPSRNQELLDKLKAKKTTVIGEQPGLSLTALPWLHVARHVCSF
jgi:hypothetical protein